MGRLYSLLGVKPAVTTIAMMPIINESLAEWDYPDAAMKEAEKIKNCIFQDGKTVVSFDLQLYVKGVMLQLKT